MGISIGGGSHISAGGAGIRSVEFQGLPCTELTLATGDTLRVAHHGAHVLSWVTADGIERLYLSPSAVMDGASAIRGGVPVCFPQFNMRSLGETALPKHGFARTLPWNMQGMQLGGDAITVSLGLQESAASLALWPHAFAATLSLRLAPGSLRMEFSVRNTGTTAWPFALALHTYLRVQGIAATQLHGLQGLRFWDAVQHVQQPEMRQVEQNEVLQFGNETDRVYEAVTHPLTLRHSGGTLRISQSATLSEVVVWNPAAALCARLPDMPPDGWQHMLCVEAACINTPVQLASGAAWSGWQELQTLSNQ